MIRNLRRLFLFLFSILSFLSAFSQQYIYTAATGTANTIPFAGTTNLRQYIYYPADFPTAPAGNITVIYIKASAATTVSFTDLTIKMGHTALSTFTAGPFATGLTTVYAGPFSGTTIAGNWVVVTLQTPFAYNGSQNFIVEASQTGFAPGFSVIQTTANVAARSLFGSIGAATGSTQDRLAHFGFDLVLAGPPCAGPPTAGNITGPTVACPGGPVNLLLNNYTSAQGITIQWESSPAGAANWSPILNANFASLSTTQTVATDYRAVVTCVNGNFTDITGTHTVTMGQFFNCYCSPLTGNMLHTSTGNYITGVSIAGTTLGSTTSAVGTGGYTQLDHTIQTNTASLTQLVPYTLDVTVGAGTYYAGAWIDYDMSGTFSASEYIQLTTSGTTASGIL